MTTNQALPKLKPPMDLIPPVVLEGMADAFGFGGRKYGDPYHYRTHVKLSEHFAALMRHLMAYWKGDMRDSESGLHPLEHALSRLAMLYWLEVSAKGHSDLYDHPVVGTKKKEERREEEDNPYSPSNVWHD